MHAKLHVSPALKICLDMFLTCPCLSKGLEAKQTLGGGQANAVSKLWHSSRGAGQGRQQQQQQVCQQTVTAEWHVGAQRGCKQGRTTWKTCLRLQGSSSRQAVHACSTAARCVVAAAGCRGFNAAAPDDTPLLQRLPREQFYSHLSNAWLGVSLCSSSNAHCGAPLRQAWCDPAAVDLAGCSTDALHGSNHLVV